MPVLFAQSYGTVAATHCHTFGVVKQDLRHVTLKLIPNFNSYQTKIVQHTVTDYSGRPFDIVQQSRLTDETSL